MNDAQTIVYTVMLIDFTYIAMQHTNDHNDVLILQSNRKMKIIKTYTNIYEYPYIDIII
jgi:hypothetical protein